MYNLEKFVQAAKARTVTFFSMLKIVSWSVQLWVCQKHRRKLNLYSIYLTLAHVLSFTLYNGYWMFDCFSLYYIKLYYLYDSC